MHHPCMWIPLSLIVVSPVLVWLVWDLLDSGPRQTWLDLTAGPFGSVHSGLLLAALLSMLLLTLSIVFLVIQGLIRNLRKVG